MSLALTASLSLLPFLVHENMRLKGTGAKGEGEEVNVCVWFRKN